MFETQEYLGYSEIAQRLGVSRQRAHAITKHRDFPDPVVKIGRHAGWSEVQLEGFVSKWERKTGRPAKASV